LRQRFGATSHPAWCDRRYCRSIQHVSRRFPVIGDVPLVLELIQDVDELVPKVSIMERDGPGVVTLSAGQTTILAGVLSQLPIP
jgi:hypothetical protein